MPFGRYLPSKYYVNDEGIEISGSKGLIVIQRCTGDINQGPGLSLFVWGVLSYCALSTAYTLVNVPYSALTPELTQDFHERTVLNGYRFGFAVVGTLTGAGAALPLVGMFSSETTGFSMMGAIFGMVMLVTALATAFTVKEPLLPKTDKWVGFFQTYLRVFNNRPYVMPYAMVPDAVEYDCLTLSLIPPFPRPAAFVPGGLRGSR